MKKNAANVKVAVSCCCDYEQGRRSPGPGLSPGPCHTEGPWMTPPHTSSSASPVTGGDASQDLLGSPSAGRGSGVPHGVLYLNTRRVYITLFLLLPSPPAPPCPPNFLSLLLGSRWEMVLENGKRRSPAAPGFPRERPQGTRGPRLGSVTWGTPALGKGGAQDYQLPGIQSQQSCWVLTLPGAKLYWGIKALDGAARGPGHRGRPHPPSGPQNPHGPLPGGLPEPGAPLRWEPPPRTGRQPLPQPPVRPGIRRHHAGYSPTSCWPPPGRPSASQFRSAAGPGPGPSRPAPGGHQPAPPHTAS